MPLNVLYISSVCHSLHILHPEKKSKSYFHHITKTHGTIICVSTGVVLLLLIISILVQVKQPRKKVIVTRKLFSIIPQNIGVEIANLSSVFNHNLVLVRFWYVRITCSTEATSRRCLTLHIMNSLLSETRLVWLLWCIISCTWWFSCM